MKTSPAAGPLAKEQPPSNFEKMQQNLADVRAKLATAHDARPIDHALIDSLEDEEHTLATRIAREERHRVIRESDAFRAEALASLRAAADAIHARQGRMVNLFAAAFEHVKALAPILAEAQALAADNVDDLRGIIRTGDHRDRTSSTATRHLATLEHVGAAFADALWSAGVGRVGIPAHAWVDIARPAAKLRPVEETIADARDRLRKLIAHHMARHEAEYAPRKVPA